MTCNEYGTPNQKTVEAMKAARRGDLVEVGTVENLLADLNADDAELITGKTTSNLR